MELAGCACRPRGGDDRRPEHRLHLHLSEFLSRLFRGSSSRKGKWKKTGERATSSSVGSTATTAPQADPRRLCRLDRCRTFTRSRSLRLTPARRRLPTVPGRTRSSSTPASPFRRRTTPRRAPRPGAARSSTRRNRLVSLERREASRPPSRLPLASFACFGWWSRDGGRSGPAGDSGLDSPRGGKTLASVVWAAAPILSREYFVLYLTIVFSS